jgi:hypothetical protein
MSEIKEKFDAVEMMRKIRDKISAEIEGMTLEEELEWLAAQQLEDPFLKRLREGWPSTHDVPGELNLGAVHSLARTRSWISSQRIRRHFSRFNVATRAVTS